MNPANQQRGQTAPAPAAAGQQPGQHRQRESGAVYDFVPPLGRRVLQEPRRERLPFAPKAPHDRENM